MKCVDESLKYVRIRLTVKLGKERGRKHLPQGEARD